MHAQDGHAPPSAVPEYLQVKVFDRRRSSLMVYLQGHNIGKWRSAPSLLRVLEKTLGDIEGPWNHNNILPHIPFGRAILAPLRIPCSFIFFTPFCLSFFILAIVIHGWTSIRITILQSMEYGLNCLLCKKNWYFVMDISGCDWIYSCRHLANFVLEVKDGCIKRLTLMSHMWWTKWSFA